MRSLFDRFSPPTTDYGIMRQLTKAKEKCYLTVFAWQNISMKTVHVTMEFQHLSTIGACMSVICTFYTGVHY